MTEKTSLQLLYENMSLPRKCAKMIHALGGILWHCENPDPTSIGSIKELAEEVLKEVGE